MHVVRSVRPCPALQPYVRAYQQRELRELTGRLIEPVPARLESCLYFNVRDTFDIRTDECDIFPAYGVAVIGLQSKRRSDLIMSGSVEGFAITFEPTGFAQLFRIPCGELIDSEFETGSFFGDSIRNLRDRIGEASTFEQRARIAEAFLLRYIPADRTPSRFLRAADYAFEARGVVRVADMARYAGLSPRQFERGFLTETGCSPKLYARIARYETALDMKIASPASSWLEIAHDLSYYDQMHMVHDFQSLVGDSPERFLAELASARPRAACHPGLDPRTLTFIERPLHPRPHRSA